MHEFDAVVLQHFQSLPIIELITDLHFTVVTHQKLYKMVSNCSSCVFGYPYPGHYELYRVDSGNVEPSGNMDPWPVLIGPGSFSPL